MTKQASNCDAKTAEDIWIFGYGSLMWRPGFAYEEVAHARLTGYRRCFCIYSVVHRGTPERPGLVLGLDYGGVCDGMVFRVAAANVEQTLSELRQREQVNGVYREAHVTVRLDSAGHKELTALTYIVERAHPGYAQNLPLARQAQIIRAAHGGSGNNLDYAFNTLRHLRSLDIHEPELERLTVLLAPHLANSRNQQLTCPRCHGLTRAHAHHPVLVRRLRREHRKKFTHRLRTQM